VASGAKTSAGALRADLDFVGSLERALLATVAEKKADGQDGQEGGPVVVRVAELTSHADAAAARAFAEAIATKPAEKLRSRFFAADGGNGGLDAQLDAQPGAQPGAQLRSLSVSEAAALPTAPTRSLGHSHHGGGTVQWSSEINNINMRKLYAPPAEGGVILLGISYGRSLHARRGARGARRAQQHTGAGWLRHVSTHRRAAAGRLRAQFSEKRPLCGGAGWPKTR